MTWTNEMDAYLIQNYTNSTNKELANSLGLGLTSVRTRLYSLGYKRVQPEYFTTEQVEFLKLNYQSIGDTELAEYYNEFFPKNKPWSKRHIEKKRRYLKLKRTDEEKKNIFIRNKEMGRFNSCAINAWKTRGSANEIGTIVHWKVRQRQYLHIKTNNGYEKYHVYLWNQINGNIPKGFNVTFIDGNTLNCTIDNLELLSDADLVIKNSKNRKTYPIEIKELEKLLKKLNQKIENYGKKQNE